MESSQRRRSSSSGSKVERKVIEKNRRELQKGLYSQLQSLLPQTHHGFNQMEVMMPSLPDQIDEAVEYIKKLKIKVEMMKEKKENLLRTSTSHTTTSFQVVNNVEVSRAQTRPMLEIQSMGPLMDIIVVSGLDRVELFYDIIRLLHQEQAIDITNATFSLNGNSLIQIMYKMGKEISGFGSETLLRKLEGLVSGSSASSPSPQSCDNYLLGLKQLPSWEFDEQLDAINNLWGSQPYQLGDNNCFEFEQI